MSIKYYLRKKADGSGGKAVDPEEIDKELCEYMGVRVDEEYFLKDWWDMMGYIAVYPEGLKSPRVRELLSHDPGFIKMLDYLAERYVLEAGR
jgi:hypothetical protein